MRIEQGLQMARATVQPGPRSTPATRQTPRPAGTSGHLGGRTLVVLAAVVGLIAVFSTDQILPATSAHQADMRVWLAARAAGFVTLGLLTMQVVLGLILGHPTNKTTWQLSRILYPWHANIWVFVLAFLAVHVVTLVLDPYAGVGISGVFIPGLSSYRTAPVAIGVMALYALLITGLTARYTQLLPAGVWLVIHRLSLGVIVMAWVHGVLAGTDSLPLAGIYAGSFVLVVMAAAYRYWVGRAGRPTFSTAIPEENR